jgi:hypothetical protein
MHCGAPLSVLHAPCDGDCCNETCRAATSHCVAPRLSICCEVSVCARWWLVLALDFRFHFRFRFGRFSLRIAQQSEAPGTVVATCGWTAATRCCTALQQVICACSPASRNYEETLGTLKFATFSKSIVNRVAGRLAVRCARRCCRRRGDSGLYGSCFLICMHRRIIYACICICMHISASMYVHMHA